MEKNGGAFSSNLLAERSRLSLVFNLVVLDCAIRSVLIIFSICLSYLSTILALPKSKRKEDKSLGFVYTCVGKTAELWTTQFACTFLTAQLENCVKTELVWHP